MADIDLTPTEEMAANAKRGLELRRKHGRGGTAVGVARARDISNRKTLSPETVRRMHAFFSRHEKNKAGGEDDAGYIAWLLWGGDSGQGWAKRKVEQMDKSENQRSETYKAIAERLGSAATNARPGAKAKMAASVRRGIDPKKGGQWINGTWDGGTWSAMVFSEPSEAYGIPEFPHISKLAINPKDKPGIGGVIVNYDRGWDIKPTTPELQKAYREIAQVATAEVNKAVKQGWYARPGAKAKMALDMSVLSGAKSLEVFIKDLMGAINVGNAREAIAVCEDISKKANDVKQRIRDTSKFSRPGAKAKMAKWTVTPTQKHGKDIEEHTAKIGRDHWKIDSMPHLGKSVGSLYRWDEMRGLRHISTGNIEQLKRQAEAISTKQDALSDVMRGFSRPGAKAAFAVAPEIIRSINAGLNKMATEIRTLQDEGDIRESNLRMKDYKDLKKVAEAISAGDGSAEHAKRIASMLYHLDTEVREFIGGATRQWLRNHTAYSRPGEKDTNAVREGSKISAEDEACLKMMAAADEKVSDKIRTLIAEGKPQKQAVAIALDLKRRGEL